MLCRRFGMSFKPVIFICGTTGVGKSKLAVDLALQFAQGELSQDWKCAKVINADAMQAYKGLDTLTNKIPRDERHGVEHLLMDFKQPGEQYVVGEWVRDATQLIRDMHDRHEIPIVVGGTSYWLQHLIFPNRLSTVIDGAEHVIPVSAEDSIAGDAELPELIQNLSPEMRQLFDTLPENASPADDPDSALKLHSLLALLDPAIAETWHWRDTRKILRSLSIIKETGRLPSSIYRRQSLDSQQPRYNTLCFWLYASMDALNLRLRSRADDMIRGDLLYEVEQLRRAALAQGTLGSAHLDFTKGIYQSIGFREFSKYLENQEPSKAQMDEALENMKIATRQYAKRQITWLRNKLFPAIYAAQSGEEAGPYAYLLDATELDSWETGVLSKALTLVQSFMDYKQLPDPRSLSDTASLILYDMQKPTDPVDMLAARRRIMCTTCTTDETKPIMLLEGQEWAIHQRTKVHRKLAAKAMRESASASWRSLGEERRKAGL